MITRVNCAWCGSKEHRSDDCREVLPRSPDFYRPSMPCCPLCGATVTGFFGEDGINLDFFSFNCPRCKGVFSQHKWEWTRPCANCDGFMLTTDFVAPDFLCRVCRVD